MKYFIIAGERSGDLHGSNLIRGILQHDPAAEIQAWGGDQMQTAGAKILKHYRDLAFMGFVEVLRNLPTIWGFMRTCKQQIQDFKPDTVILIDYAGFNLRIADFAKKAGFRVFYYISPKVWAWNQKRALKIKARVDKLFCIFPFEVDFFKKFNFEVEYVGNPLLDSIKNYQLSKKGIEAQRHKSRYQLPAGGVPLISNELSDVMLSSSKHDPLNSKNATHHSLLITHHYIALLPGSRKQEVEKMLPLMVSVARYFPDYVFEIARVDNLPNNLYDQYLSDNVRLSESSTYDLLNRSVAALVTSGTATLETALFNVPQVVCYRANGFSYQIAKRLIRVPFISLVNLIAEKEVVKELIQNDLNTESLKKHLAAILPPSVNRQEQLREYQRIRNILGEAGASERTGKRIVDCLRELGK